MAQGRGNAFVFALAVLALLQAAVAKDYTVGDTNEWSYPPGTDTTYYTSTWATKYSFAPGDNLGTSLPCLLCQLNVKFCHLYSGV